MRDQERSPEEQMLTTDGNNFVFTVPVEVAAFLGSFTVFLALFFGFYIYTSRRSRNQIPTKPKPQNRHLKRHLTSIQATARLARGLHHGSDAFWSPLHNAFKYTYTGSGFTLNDMENESDEEPNFVKHTLRRHLLSPVPSPPIPSTPTSSPGCDRRDSEMSSQLCDPVIPMLMQDKNHLDASETASNAVSESFMHSDIQEETDNIREPEVTEAVIENTGNPETLGAAAPESNMSVVVSHQVARPKHPRAVQDLISLAERGWVGMASSCSSSSGDDDSSQRSLRHRFFRRQSTEEDCSTSTPRSTNEPGPIAIADAEDQIFDLRNFEGPYTSNPTISSKCGCVEVAFSYDAFSQRMSLAILQARDIPNRSRGGANVTQVRVLLLPSRKQRHRTRILPGDNPIFHETFIFSSIPPDEVNSMGVRIRLYGCEKLRRERMIGEMVVGFASLNLDIIAPMWLTLEPPRSGVMLDSRSEVSSVTRSESTGSSHSESVQSMCRSSNRSSTGSSSRGGGGIPELLLSLSYSAVTGRLTVEVIKGSHFRSLTAPRAPDTYVRLSLACKSGQEISTSRTSVRRNQSNPTFKEIFMYQIPVFQLGDVTLMISVFSRKGVKKKDMVGWFSLGCNSSGEEELAHWTLMRESTAGEEVCRWHVLLDP
ncbi:unnamed protein product [Cyprideis torosa]|uniref:Uncharacterized protein n=1 Tax=Cyprideis torosa TaxID=163714 RepID=A0A7R8ZGN1_9CRUS|nr:unnamed protein product [Cyprideis torosa]CAG0880519.1 unnamed protein product [Cyprideis torosa]